MPDTVAIVTPCFRAERWIGAAVRSVLAQSWGEWEHWIVSDDGADYEALLAREGLRDERLRFASTGTVGSGASRARNVALDQITAPYVAVLDADDRFKPEKLRRAVAALEHYAVVSMAIEDCDESGNSLRLVGAGTDRELPPGSYKWTALSMDSMIVWDRRRTDGRYDPDLPNMNDLELLLQLFRTAPACWHLGTPLHDYVKVSSSLSNGEGVTERMIRAKSELLRRLETGFYPMADTRGPEGMAAFLRISLRAEETFGEALAAKPGLLFEDHLEPMLRANPPLV
ncbi:MAG TPA: glycosyltransferase family A protein [Devosia sp.]|jgi:glycosyltransferase involved in cell wall biosynthesis|nr:glycosyltransferase family A protein [Devosia sp.]